MFWPVMYSSMAASAVTFVVVYGYWRWWPNRRHKRRVKDMAAMRDLLVHHVDDLDDIMDKLQHGTCEAAGLQLAVLSCVCVLLVHLTRQCCATSWGLYSTMMTRTVLLCVCVSATPCSASAAMIALNVRL